MADKVEDRSFKITCPVEFTFKGKFYGVGDHYLGNKADHEMFSGSIKRWYRKKAEKDAYDKEIAQRQNPSQAADTALQTDAITKIVEDAIEVANAPLKKQIGELTKELQAKSNDSETEEKTKKDSTEKKKPIVKIK